VPEDLVTVAVSLYNYGRFLPECLESVLAQRHPHLELVVVDDASETDDSVAVARAWLSEHAQSFARVQLLRHARNQGLAEARNTAFAAARSEFVFVLDADNMIYPRAISRLYEVMRHREFAAAYTQLEFFGSERRLGFADVFEKDRLIPGNYIDAMALVSKRTWESVGGYTHMEGWEDYDFWCKVVDCGLAAAYVPEILCRYRVHPASMLRNDTVKSLQQIVVELTMRHPWISIG
jgi:glycosyltransferase involved in cell wall biosynthesis